MSPGACQERPGVWLPHTWPLHLLQKHQHIRNIWGALNDADSWAIAAPHRTPPQTSWGTANILPFTDTGSETPSVRWAGESICPLHPSRRTGFKVGKCRGNVWAMAVGSRVQASNPLILQSLPCRLNHERTELAVNNPGDSHGFITAPLRFERQLSK